MKSESAFKRHYGSNRFNALQKNAIKDTLNSSKYRLNQQVIKWQRMNKLYLLESYCLPILTYDVEGLPLKKNQIGKLNTCGNNAYRKIFRMKKWESV